MSDVDQPKNKIEQANFIKQKFSAYLKSMFEIRDKCYNDLFLQRLNELESNLYKGPYLASNLPLKKDKSINELISSNFFEKRFSETYGLDLDRPCYVHQIEAFKSIKNNRNVVITTGTGSGKTECFMFPIINELLAEIRKGDKSNGIRAIFLFPLNALVYDQIDRLRELLKNFSDIKFGFYTGKTPEDRISRRDKKVLEEYKKMYGDNLPNELVTRKEMRETPPQILFTNYAMLEYLLIRPLDKTIISESALDRLKFIVLDEAHTYRGSLGIEISLLMRRLIATANKCPQFILTSATLGRGKEDAKDIAKFANRLTGSYFDKDRDIIFRTNYELDTKKTIKIKFDDYILLDECFKSNNVNQAKSIFRKYGIDYNESLPINVNLYKMLSLDSNVDYLYSLSRNVMLFSDIADAFNMSDSQLVSFVNVVSNASSTKNEYGYKLLDIKYHLFLKAPDGAFITIGKRKNLSLLTCVQIDGYKAFKIGICGNCKTPYIMGITEGNILCIDDEIDIDESYSDKARRLEYYILKDSLISDEEVSEIESNDKFVKYEICAKCGFIKKANDALDNKCEHFDENKVILYKYIGKTDNDIERDDESVTNNLHICPICSHKENSGIVVGFHVGKDRATTLLSQILYESMEYPKTINYKKNLRGELKPEIIEHRKQYLSFSDSRQQAAFFSKFSNVMNDTFLRKTIIWRILQENKHESISYSELVERLTDIYKKEISFKDQFDNDSDDAAAIEAISTALWELHLVDSKNSCEGLGLYAFILNLDKNGYSDENILDILKQYNMNDKVTPEQFRILTRLTLQALRTYPSIEYGNKLSYIGDKDKKRELLNYRDRKLYVKKQVIKSGKDKEDKYYPVKSFLPIKNTKTETKRTNDSIRYLQKALNLNYDEAINLLGLIFDYATDVDCGNLLEKNLERLEYPDTYLLNAKKFNLHSYKHLKFFKCNKCKTITLYNINNACPEPCCNGKLYECNPESEPFLRDNYYRNEYLSRKPERLISKEHTAQMNSDEAKRIQYDFREGNINFISCSTTFEMGIDLGKLNTIFMRNVPPSPSNYAQRAGRAGRRANTSAFIVTFCNNSSHDYTFFDDPREMIKGLVKPPYFVIDNDKIILRHITAAALSMFFRDNDNDSEREKYFDSAGQFVEDKISDKFFEYIESHPTKLGDMVDNHILNDKNLIEKFGNYKWVDYIKCSESEFNKMNEGIEGLKKTYEEAKEIAKINDDGNLVNSFKDAINRLNSKNSLITNLSKYNVIPSYGFPVDNVDLHIYNVENEEMDNRFNLSRDLSIAISEYAPGSEIIVADKKYTSRYLLLPRNNYSLPMTYYCKCSNPDCGGVNVSKDPNYFVSGRKCKYCGYPLDISQRKRYITPIYGFVADQKNKSTNRIKPFKTYASDKYYIGESLKSDSELNDVVNIKEYSNEELLVLNENRFYFCESCGYTELDKNYHFDKKVSEHKQYNTADCKCGKPLQLIHLGHSFKTDLVQMSFKGIDEMNDSDTAISVLFAILYGISQVYQIERSDIDGLVRKAGVSMPYELILFDNVSGGAGHVKRLKDSSLLMDVINKAIDRVSNCTCGEDTSCYGCLRTYNNQKLHKHIKRGLAKKALVHIKNEILNKKIDLVLEKPNINFTDENIDDFLTASYLDDTSNKLLRDLINQLKINKCKLPDGYGFMLKNNENSMYQVDFAWINAKILLFSIDNKKDYDDLVNSQKKFKCYLLTESFDINEFIKENLYGKNVSN